LACLAAARCAFAQDKAPVEPQSQSGFTMRLPVDEVVLTFHATDLHGVPVNDLQAGEVRLLDNGAPPRRVFSFESLVDRPMRAALLLDTSESMQQALPASRAIAGQFAERVFRAKTDQAMIMDFGYSSEFLQPWTGDQAALARSIQWIRWGRMNPRPGTAIADTVFRACYYGFKKIEPGTSGNVLILFSDGVDNSGHMSVEEALRACQQNNVVIYAFRFPSSEEIGSMGARNLQDLASGTGGRVFPADDTAEAIGKDLKTIESEVRNQYRLVYTPARLEHNGRFHSIEVQLPDRVKRVEVRSGYYAPMP
jgi:VWFA-related protein